MDLGKYVRRVLQSGIRSCFTLFGCYMIPQSGIRAWFNTWTGWEKCACHACMLVVNVFVLHVSFYIFVTHALLWSWFSCMRSWYAVGIVMHVVDILF